MYQHRIMHIKTNIYILWKQTDDSMDHVRKWKGNLRQYTAETKYLLSSANSPPAVVVSQNPKVNHQKHECKLAQCKRDQQSPFSNILRSTSQQGSNHAFCGQLPCKPRTLLELLWGESWYPMPPPWFFRAVYQQSCNLILIATGRPSL